MLKIGMHILSMSVGFIRCELYWGKLIQSVLYALSQEKNENIIKRPKQKRQVNNPKFHAKCRQVFSFFRYDRISLEIFYNDTGEYVATCKIILMKIEDLL